jgi:hypothetical protein
VSFFAYPGQPSELWPAGCDLQVLAGPEHDVTGALEALAETVGPPGSSRGEGSPGRVAPRTVPARPAGALTSETLAAAIASVMPEGCVIVDESNTAGIFLPGATEGALATTGSATPAARSVRDFPSPRVPPLLHKTAQYCAWRPTEAPCIRSKRSGRRHAKVST